MEDKTCFGSMETVIQMIMDTINNEMKPNDLVWFYRFGENENVCLGVLLDEDHDITFYVEPWDEEDEVYVTDWDGSDYYFISEKPDELDRLCRDLQQVWEDSGKYILENL